MKTAVEWLVDELYKQGISLYTPELIEQAKEIDNRLKHESIESQVAILKDTLDEMMTGFDSEENRMDFILDICNGYKKRIETKQQEQ
jgi:hypothetical protein